MVVTELEASNDGIQLFHEGTLYDSYKYLGAHLIKLNDKLCTQFSVWAPQAKEIRLVGDFNNWNGDGYSFHRLNNEGIWSFLVHENLEGSLYKYEITTSAGDKILKG